MLEICYKPMGLNADCLQSILEYLQFYDLAQAQILCKGIHEAAQVLLRKLRVVKVGDHASDFINCDKVAIYLLNYRNQIMSFSCEYALTSVTTFEQMVRKLKRLKLFFAPRVFLCSYTKEHDLRLSGCGASCKMLNLQFISMKLPKLKGICVDGCFVKPDFNDFAKVYTKLTTIRLLGFTNELHPDHDRVIKSDVVKFINRNAKCKELELGFVGAWRLVRKLTNFRSMTSIVIRHDKNIDDETLDLLKRHKGAQLSKNGQNV
eukprot:TRINITY_DN146_c0_g1_i2.p1 TRINITY_DN146_c0_g1~~TRINITY_DN146_c0_g1_i2.p1  ORF type:complete len:262 (+),score=32.99 TRINITY_DN146_c0_g1_i2:373-1158(+)